MSPPAVPVQLPEDVSLCHELIRQLVAACGQSQQRIAQLEHQLEQLYKAHYGPRAEKIDPEQLWLFAREILEQAKIEPPPEKPKAAREPRPSNNGHGRRMIPEGVPREPVVHDLPEEEKPCPCCGEMRQPIGEEKSLQIEYEPPRLRVIEHIRPKYACRRCEGQFTIAEMPLQPIQRGLAGPGLLAHIITSKYGDHLPLYRQEDILARYGIEIPRSTMWGWMGACADLLNPLYQLMKSEVLESKVIPTDDTPVPVLEPGRGKTRQGRIWTYVGDKDHPSTVFDYTPTRSRDGPANFFGDYAGYIQADAFGGYDHLFKPREDGAPRPTEVGCWAHARRKFVEAQTSDALRSCTAVAMIRLLYEVEAAARELNSADRRAMRQEHSVPLLEKIHAWLMAEQSHVMPKSPMAQAIHYCLANWIALIRYVEDGDLAIDNNAAENALRPIAVGRKNWLFAGSDRGGRTGAILTSFTATCRRHGIDPFAYLRDVLTRIAGTPVSQLGQFLPDRWKADRQAQTAAE